MRRTNTSGAVEKVTGRWPLRGRVALAGLVVIGAGLGLYSFGQEAYLALGLSHQAAQIAMQNATLADQNAGYRRDIGVLGSGAGAEEQERLNGYARRGEQVYLVGQPPAASPAGPARKASARQGAGGKPGLIEMLKSWLADLGHR